MTYNDIFYNSRVLLNNIPVGRECFSFGSHISTSVIMLQVAYEGKIKEFNDFMSETLKKLKKEGFDDRTQKIREMEDVDRRMKSYTEWEDSHDEGKERPKKPSDEELISAEETRKTKPEYDNELEELNNAYNEAQSKKAKEEVAGFDAKFDRSEYEELVSCIGVSGDIEVDFGNGNKSRMNKVDFLRMIATSLVR